jgi:hypothetical protein
MPENTQQFVSPESLEAKHEMRDRNPRNVLIVAASAVMLIFFSLVVCGILFSIFSAHRRMQEMHPLGIIIAPNLKPLTRFPKPNLQVDDDHAQMTALLAAQDEKLNSYGWVDRSNGIIRIPIGRAMDLILQRGLPTRSLQTATNNSQTDGTPLQLIQNISQQQ